MRPILALLLVALVGASTASSPAPAASQAVSLDVVAFACGIGDGVCLGYGGGIPGPTFTLRHGDTLVVTLTNRIAETVAPLDAPQAVKDELAAARSSFHAHGLIGLVTNDGVPAHDGTLIPDSTVAPGASFTYTLRADFPGVWHYHDHVIGADGQEGVNRGMFGTIVVRDLAEVAPHAVLDLHLLDAGANGGAGFAAQVPAHSSFELDVTGMGNWVWSLELETPAGASVGTVKVGPGTSERLRVADAAPGAYAWTATSRIGTAAGEVVVS